RSIQSKHTEESPYTGIIDEDKGCPWDKVQTHETLKRYLLEEKFELFEAIDNEDDWHMIEELGDILLQVLLHTSIGKKEEIKVNGEKYKVRPVTLALSRADTKKITLAVLEEAKKDKDLKKLMEEQGATKDYDKDIK
ncbi:MazG nucleotide pyrophosphohydrolase domain-containing protein, partial [Staphylococcus aureus]|uniref:MazG nucleotide pyrophosphohydrolase domain-containing protein n=1 Tax=Staphylococcus aureus TaxID=1280 RepID=UPI00272DFC1F